MAMTLREARKRRGWTQKQLELASGIQQGSLSRLELATDNPKLDTVRTLEQALGLKPGTLTFRRAA